MVLRSGHQGQVYLTTKCDGAGNLLRADNLYRLHVPKDVPVGQFRGAHSLQREHPPPLRKRRGYLSVANLDSRLKDLNRRDVSVDLYVGPTTPKGYASTFMKTVDDDGWLIYFRL